MMCRKMNLCGCSPPPPTFFFNQGIQIWEQVVETKALSSVLYNIINYVPLMILLIWSLSSCFKSAKSSKSSGSSIFFVVALARLNVSKIHAGWNHCFMSPPSSENGFGVTFPVRSAPFSIFCLHFLQLDVPNLAYPTQYLLSDIVQK